MRPHLIVVLALTLLLSISSLAMAAGPGVHFFDCKECHLSGYTTSQLGGANVCLSCHNPNNAITTTMNAGNPQGYVAAVKSDGKFAEGDASNQYGNNLAFADQTSHNWAATSKNPAAGAKEPDRVLHPGLYSRYGTTVGKVACSRCHNPHGEFATNPKLMPLSADKVSPMSANATCLACHADFNKDGSLHGLVTHPVGMIYNPSAPGFKAIDNGTNGGIALMGDGSVSCTTCHGVHATDSDSTTPDGFAGTPGAGDGLLLKHNGPSIEDPVAADGICQACHIYEGHAMSGADKMGCMVCHGGHAYDATAPNYYMLNKQVTLPFVPKLGGPGTVTLDYTVDPTTTSNYDNGTGINGSLCLNCHNLPGTHIASAACADCHNHDAENGSFGAGCGSCHGYAPDKNVDGNLGTGGYAHSTVNIANNYSTAGATIFKDESATPHARHANGAGNYTFACADCHGLGSGNLNDLPGAGNHDGGTFQQVLDTRIGALTPLLTAMPGAPTYNETAGGNTGTCSAVYCHSNGRVTRGAVVPVQAVAVGPWKAGAGTISSCTVCHNIGGANDSATHDAHISKYACVVCHSTTATNATTLTATAIGTTHVNGVLDAVFSGLGALGGSGVYDDSQGTCATYCHSNGNGTNVQTPDWDDANTGNCGDCHGGPSGADSVIASGSHTIHLNSGISCDSCHGAGAVTGTHAGHIDGDGPLNYDVVVNCNVCHGATAGQTSGVDRVPAWGDGTSVDCETCHSGVVAVINAASAPLVAEAAYDNGHGKAGVAQVCTDCHAAALDPNHLGGAATDRLDAGLPAYAAGNDVNFCTNCHAATTNNHSALDGSVCKTCHAQHGEANGFDAMLKSAVAGNTVTGFTTQGARASYVNASFTGICQTCHTTQKYFSKTKFENLTHNYNSNEACSDCHTHSSTPKAFAGAGNACDACHGFPPATAAHDLHAPDSNALVGPVDFVTYPALDRSACAACHTGADLYTYIPSDDQASGTPGRVNHNVSEASQDATLLASVGYTGSNCASACHDGASGVTAAWTDTSLACSACHYQAADPTQAGNTGDVNTVSAGHNAHFASGGAVVCTDCHASIADTAHITDRSGATEYLKVQGMATAVQNEALVSAGATFNTVAKTCATASCHNDARPGADVVTPAWGFNAPNCTQCHLASPTTGSHTKHIPDAANCSTCHTSALKDTSYNNTNHYDGNIDVAAGGYPTDKAINSAFTSCTTATCHDDGRSANTTPNWGTAAADACVACHDAIPATGSHVSHVADAAVDCNDCHTGAVQSTTAPTLNHRDGNVNAGSGYPVQAKGSAFSNCSTASCHNDGRNSGVTGTWGTAINNCAECHATVPTTGGHGKHIGVSFGGAVIACADCHAGAVQGTTAPTANHRDGSVNATGYPVQANGSAFTTCTTASCHQTGQAANAYTTTPIWNVDTANCTQCHAALPATGSHTKHLTVTSNTCWACHGAAALSGLSYNNANHGDLNVDVVIGGYTADKALGAAMESCTYSCHSDGMAADGTSPIWGTATAACTSCHLSDMVTGSHGAHLADGADCGACHDGAIKGSNFGTAHTDGDVDVIETYATPNAAYGAASWTTCSAASCHDDGRAPNVTSTWGTTVNNCAECHATQPATGSHAAHLAASALGSAIDCGDCHTGAVEGTTAPTSTHRDGNTNATGYPVTTNGGAFQSCATINCHSNGLTATGSTPLWGNTGDCATCHLSNMVSGSHTVHLASGALCGNCHNGAVKDSNPGTAHIDGNVDAIAGYATANAAYGSGTWTTCNAASCHDNGTGTLATTPNWGTASACNECHLDNMATASHTNHLTTTISANAISCGNCHADAVKATTAPTAGVHINNTLQVYNVNAGDLGYPNNVAKGGAPYDSCSTTYCHGDTLAYSVADGIDVSPQWGANLGARADNCDACHGYPPNGGGSHPASADCSACHFHVNDNDTGFTGVGGDVSRHIDGTVQVDGGDACTACHAGGAYKDPDSGDHSVHTNADTVLAGKGLVAGDYGSGAWWYAVTYDATGRPQMGCGQCHPATIGTHLNGSVQTDLDPAGETIAGNNAKKNSLAGANYAGGTCSSVYCHSDGAGTFANVTNWNAVAGDKGITCASCHGNSPTTNAHGVHEVGIHYEELYNGTSGLLAATGGVGSGAAHGDTNVSTTINCFTCHNNTVSDSANAGNSTCSSCHSDTNTILTGNELARIKVSSTVHLNGAKDVNFAVLTGFKSKAQLRSDLADADDGSNILSNIWNRLTGYKGATDRDEVKVAFATPTFSGGSCSTVACHNGNPANWTDSGVDCLYCHTSLPK